jgi:hypothetical protein
MSAQTNSSGVSSGVIVATDGGRRAGAKSVDSVPATTPDIGSPASQVAEAASAAPQPATKAEEPSVPQVTARPRRADPSEGAVDDQVAKGPADETAAPHAVSTTASIAPARVAAPIAKRLAPVRRSATRAVRREARVASAELPRATTPWNCTATTCAGALNYILVGIGF